jgi:ferredoxin-type protein NapH
MSTGAMSELARGIMKKRQSFRKILLLVSFSVFPITIVYLAPAPPIMSLKAGVINLSVVTTFTIFLSGFFVRRAFCGWLCPGGGCQLVAQALSNDRLQHQRTNWIRVFMVSVWVVIMTAVIVLAGRWPTLDLGHPGAGKFATSHVRYFLPYIPTVIFMFLFVLLFGRRGFCHRGCWIYPIVAFSSKIGALLHVPCLHVTARNCGRCSHCKLCTSICPMSIDVCAHVQTKAKLPNNCIQCGLCVDTCPKRVLAFSLGIEQ